MSAPALLERDEPLMQLGELLDDARQGAGRTALVRGEAGIGKTSFARRFVDEIGDDVHVLWGYCDDLTTPVPLGALRDMASIEPTLAAALSSDDRSSAFQTTLDLLSRSLRPTVMVIEDIHWADDATLDLVRFVGRRIGRTHGLMVLTYRNEVASVGERVRLALGDLPSNAVTRIALAPLSASAVETLAATDDVDDIMELTGGNPFMVTELLSNAESAVPQSVVDSVLGRLSRLGPEERDFVELVSVIPGRADIVLLSSLVGDVQSPMAAAEDSGLLLVEGSTVRFRHELARRGVESELPQAKRQALNLQVLSALEDDSEDPSRLAHYARTAGDRDAIVRILPSAARLAAASGNHREALEHLSAMEPYLGELDLGDLADHHDFWAEQAYLSTDPRATELAGKAVELRRRIGEPIALGKSLLASTILAWSDISTAVSRAEVIEEALGLLEAGGPSERAAALAKAARLHLYSYDFERTLEYGRKVLAIEDAPPAARIDALGCVGWVLVTARYPEGVSEMEAAFSTAAEEGLLVAQVGAASNLSARYSALRRPAESKLWAERGLAAASNGQVLVGELHLQGQLVWAEETAGNWDVATRLAGELVDRLPASHAVALAARTEIARIRVRQGAPNALQMTLGLWNEAKATGTPMQAGQTSWPVSERIWLANDIPGEVVDDMIDLMNAVFERDEVVNAGELAHYLYLAGHIPVLPEKTPHPYASLVNGDWSAAASFWEERGCPYEWAMCLSFGDVDARLAALRTLDELQAAPLATRIRRGLQAEGVKGVPRGPYRGRRSSDLGLTPRQTEILELLRASKSNSEIADELFLSVRTVEQHVSAILSTLGVNSRQEAARMVEERA